MIKSKQIAVFINVFLFLNISGCKQADTDCKRPYIDGEWLFAARQKLLVVVVYLIPNLPNPTPNEKDHAPTRAGVFAPETSIVDQVMNIWHERVS